MPSDAPPPPTATSAIGEHRLHPFSWLFVLISQLRPFAVPLLLVFFVGRRGEWWDIVGVAGAAAAALYAFVTALAFRYRLSTDELIIREGVLDRTERHVSYARIQNIVQRRNPLHRLFGVTELRLESAGGTKPEAVMNVIRTSEAARIEAVLRGHVSTMAGDEADDRSDVLLAMTTRDVIGLGLVTNRGLVVVGAVLALLSQVQPWEWDHRAMRTAARAVRDAVFAWGPARSGLLDTMAVIVAVFMAVAVLQKLLSTVMALLTFHGFRLIRQDERIATERGLLVRQEASARRDKIQRLLAGEPWLARRLGRRWLWCEVAAGTQGDGAEGQRLRWLAPLATPATIEAVADAVAPGLTVEARRWRPLHPRAWRRRLLPSAVMWTFGCLLAANWLGAWTTALWVLGLPWWYYEARRWAETAGWACNDGVLAFRAGWLHRQWTMARLTKGQVVVLHRSPFDRRHGMARVGFDTAGASRSGLGLDIPFLPEAEARALFDELRSRLVEHPEERRAVSVERPQEAAMAPDGGPAEAPAASEP
jgi:putative membrane protein